MEFPSKEDKKSILDGTFFLPDTPADGNKNEFKQYRRKGLSEMRQVVPAESLVGISISEVDKQLLKEFPNVFMQGYVARNPKDHADQWYVAKKYFDDNLEPVTTLRPAKKQEIKYYLVEGMTEIVPLSFEDWKKAEIEMTDNAMDEWATKLLMSDHRVKISQELQDKLNSLPFADWC